MKDDFIMKGYLSYEISIQITQIYEKKLVICIGNNLL